MNLNALTSTGKWLVLIIISIVLTAGSCRKEVEPVELPTPPTKWEVIAGTYKVYDTTGVYLYEMKMVPVYEDKNIIDSVRFENFDGEFNFSSKQMYPDPENIPMYIRIGVHDTLYDTQSKRWRIGGGISEVYNNFKNDTIRLKFTKTNINYYLSDLTPYYACDCQQIAVKQ